MEEKLREHIEKRVTLTDDEFAFVLAHLTMKSCKKYECLIQEGERVPTCFYVISGLLRLTYADESGKRHIVSFAMEDYWECDFDAFFNQTRATMSLDCLEDTVVYGLSLSDFNRLGDSLPKIERFFRILANRGHSALQRRLLSLLTIQAKDRYEQFINQYPFLSQRISKTLLASYLGVSRETLSRLST